MTKFGLSSGVAEVHVRRWSFVHILRAWGLCSVWVAGPAWAQDPAGAEASQTPAPASASASSLVLRWQGAVPRVQGRLRAEDLGVVINTSDPYSVAVGEYYVRRRGVPQEQVLRVSLPVQATLPADVFQGLVEQIRGHMGPAVQALALVWRQPYAVGCQSITSAITLGLDPALCSHSCGAPQQPSRYFNARSSQPFKDLGLRPSMLLAAADVGAGQALVDRGAASDHSLLATQAPVQALYLYNDDMARSVRLPLFPPPGPVGRSPVAVHLGKGVVPDKPTRMLLVQTGAARLDGLDGLNGQWVPGALADHLTSFGGVLDGSAGQSPALDWITSGATASYGTVSEPCNHVQKFPHPQLLLLHYLQGASALEAYWKSVAWPQQGVFIGEPLAAPFAPYFQVGR